MTCPPLLYEILLGSVMSRFRLTSLASVVMMVAVAVDVATRNMLNGGDGGRNRKQ